MPHRIVAGEGAAEGRRIFLAKSQQLRWVPASRVNVDAEEFAAGFKQRQGVEREATPCRVVVCTDQRAILNPRLLGGSTALNGTVETAQGPARCASLN